MSAPSQAIPANDDVSDDKDLTCGTYQYSYPCWTATGRIVYNPGQCPIDPVLVEYRKYNMNVYTVGQKTGSYLGLDYICRNVSPTKCQSTCN